MISALRKTRHLLTQFELIGRIEERDTKTGGVERLSEEIVSTAVDRLLRAARTVPRHHNHGRPRRQALKIINEI